MVNQAHEERAQFRRRDLDDGHHHGVADSPARKLLGCAQQVKDGQGETQMGQAPGSRPVKAGKGSEVKASQAW